MNTVKAPSVAGILGVYCAGQESIERIQARFHLTRHAGTVRVTRDLFARRDPAQKPGPSDNGTPSALISGPHITLPDRAGHGDRSRGVIVCFDGHLVEPVPGIEMSVEANDHTTRSVTMSSTVRQRDVRPRNQCRRRPVI